jgi:hypothetical protein
MRRNLPLLTQTSFTPKDINETPANFDIQSAGNVAITDFTPK